MLALLIVAPQAVEAKGAEIVVTGQRWRGASPHCCSMASEPRGRVWRLSDKVLLRPGVPLLDLLNGDVLRASGGQPRHELKLDLSRNADGLGISIGGKWQSSTRYKAADLADALRFLSLVEIYAKLFSDLDQLRGWGERTWTQNLKITFAVKNVFNRRVCVTNGLEKTPLIYQPSYLDPGGRFVSLSVRKLL